MSDSYVKVFYLDYGFAHEDGTGVMDSHFQDVDYGLVNEEVMED